MVTVLNQQKRGYPQECYISMMVSIFWQNWLWEKDQGFQTNGNWRFIYTLGNQIRKKDIFKKRSDNVGLRLRQYWRFGWFWASIDCDLMWQQADGPHGKPNEVPHPFPLFLSLLEPPHQTKIVLANMRQHCVISTLLLWHWSVVNDVTWNIEPYVF